MTTLGCAVVGTGFMGRTHIRAYLNACSKNPGVKLVAVVCENPAELRDTGSGNLGPNPGTLADQLGGVRIYDHVDALCADPEVGAASVCTPTDTHVDIGVRLMRAGKHVLMEKPVALCREGVATLDQESRRTGRRCVPAMCMRYWPGWDWLRQAVASRRYGLVRSATFTRLGSEPTWNRGFYLDPARSGGAMFDLHVHDADAILWLLGMPARVYSAGHVNHLTTVYHFENPETCVVAEGGWLSTPGFPFRMRYRVEFEHAVADWDLSRGADQLRLTTPGGTVSVALEEASAYDRQVAAFIDSLLAGTPGVVTLDDAARVTTLLEMEKASLASGIAQCCSDAGW